MVSKNDLWPSVGVVVPTHNRVAMLYAAIRSVRQQDYEGHVEVIVVFDDAHPDKVMAREIERLGCRWTLNKRTKGLPGARNTGVLTLDTELVASCDDDDTWYPAKLRKQVTAWRSDPDAFLMASGITVLDPTGAPHLRLLGRNVVVHEELLRNRTAPVHSSALLFRRETLIEIGMFDESAPHGHNEDWDILLRGTRHGHVGIVDEPLVAAPWGRTSYFTYDYSGKIESFDWILEQHPDLYDDAIARARVLGQKAYWMACDGDYSRARASAMESIRVRPTQPRGYLALVATTPLMSATWLLSIIHKLGRGI